MGEFDSTTTRSGKSRQDQYDEELRAKQRYDNAREFGGVDTFTGGLTTTDNLRSGYTGGISSELSTMFPTFNTPEARSTLASLSGSNPASSWYTNRLNLTPGTITPQVQKVINTLSGISDEGLGQQLATTRGKFFRAADSAGQLGFEETFRRNKLERDSAIANLLQNLTESDLDRQADAAAGITRLRGQDINFIDLISGQQTARDIAGEEETFLRDTGQTWTEERTTKLIDLFRQASSEEFDFKQGFSTLSILTEGMTEKDIGLLEMALSAKEFFSTDIGDPKDKGEGGWGGGQDVIEWISSRSKRVGDFFDMVEGWWDPEDVANDPGTKN